eukprot:jgi/Tetstr1/453360/TSEL_040350.t1
MEQPKVELHRHIEGSVQPETIWRLQQEGLLECRFSSLEAVRDKVALKRPVEDWQEFFKDFEVFQQVFTKGGPAATREAVRDQVEHAADVEGIDLLELRWSPAFMSGLEDTESLQASLRGGAEYPPEWDDHMQAIIEGCSQGAAGRNIRVGLIPLVSRNFGTVSGMMTVAFARRWRPHVVGFDFAADESKATTTKFCETAAGAAALGLPLTVHTGEGYTADFISHTLDSYGSAVRRLGHAVSLVEDDAVLQRCRRAGITVESCPTSNFLMGTIPCIAAHPLPQMIQQGVQVSVNTDDPALFGVTLNDEWEACLNQLNVSRAQLLQLDATARAASFITAAA